MRYYAPSDSKGKFGNYLITLCFSKFRNVACLRIYIYLDYVIKRREACVCNCCSQLSKLFPYITVLNMKRFCRCVCVVISLQSKPQQFRNCLIKIYCLLSFLFSGLSETIICTICSFMFRPFLKIFPESLKKF